MAGTKTTQQPTEDAKTPEQKLPSHQTVLILRDERVGQNDYKPGDTPKLTYDRAQQLIKRGAADGDHGAIRAAQARRKAKG
ncbi:hypothetical protein [Halomonas caseinilytica]|uniref:Uncharacterized protein n=1 Tax=Halomonas caseinilytica TaxID=438744 RepID=A0A1M6UHM0_9GAMM|nr:hypothetical protein [Halomonas caseinilytica]SHK68722.1 hypothetical protein SAMN05192556_104269 [Halomonas caseinilytica]